MVYHGSNHNSFAKMKKCDQKSSTYTRVTPLGLDQTYIYLYLFYKFILEFGETLQ